MILSAIITPVIRIWVPVVTIVFLGFAASESPETDNNGIVGDSHCSWVVGLNGGLGLWPAHSDKSLSHGRYRLGCDKQACKLRFGGQRHDKLDDLGDGEDWSVESQDIVVLR